MSDSTSEAASGKEDATRALLQERLVPRPREIDVLPGELPWGGRPFTLQLEGAFSAGSHQQLAGLLQRICRADGPEVSLRAVCQGLAESVPGPTMDESYRLEINRSGVVLTAPSEVGIARGARTLVQILAMHFVTLPCLRISDAPALPWRGLLLDVARHFIDLPELLRTIDGMAHHKLNVLHLHLTDDQAFRFPSAAYPKLNEGGPCYTRDELYQLVGYAGSRGIRVVPELDMPGHTTSWLAAYPEWSLYPADPTERFGVHSATLNPSAEETWQVIGTLLDEFGEVFPDEVVHVGGDEVHPRWWREHPQVQAFMSANGFAEPRDLQAYFQQRVSELLAARGKRMLVWDEAIHAELPPGTIVQAWRGMTARDSALAAGHSCIVSAPYYLDLFYPADLHTSIAPQQPLADALAAEDGLLQDVRLRHVAQGLEWTRQWRERDESPVANEPGRVMGAEACLWSELVDTELLEVRLWSRLPLLAELFWLGEGVGDTQSHDYLRLEHALTSWSRVGGPDLVPALCGALSTNQVDLLAPLGVTWAHAPLLTVLEPAKWYFRLLGREALAARLAGSEMPKARPYSTKTPLRGIADVLSPQSFRAAQLGAALARWRESALTDADVALLHEFVDDARSIAPALVDYEVAEALREDLGVLAGRFEKFANLLFGLLQRCADEPLGDAALAALPIDELHAALEPVGELMLGVVAPLLAAAESAVQRTGAPD